MTTLKKRLAKENPVREVTPMQLNEGYLEFHCGFIRRRSFIVVRKLPNGNFMVVDPKAEPCTGECCAGLQR